MTSETQDSPSDMPDPYLRIAIIIANDLDLYIRMVVRCMFPLAALKPFNPFGFGEVIISGYFE